ncbi:TPA: phosphomannomutase [Enterobacter hormaechei]|uniref:phosphomannomutase n=1 Tax=Enterobacter hormaechei TaxID=158836 RepID=UPI00288AEFB9|nr:phosphomannomutase [Enterobacter hormaechei]WNJ33416.1 phosphomannomutase [Enterobacter hormaechei subsp. hormaechei]HDR1954074.1 phosphomannomutase [Enterobacter hormaechei]
MNNLSTKDIINNSTIMFGTSGARGMVEAFTDLVVRAYVSNFVTVVSKSKKTDEVFIAIDNRPSSYGIALSCANALKNLGVNYRFYGVIPTPALAYHSLSKGVPAIMVTGSHIPFDRNGLKFYTSTGEITKQDELDITNCDIPLNDYEIVETLTIDESAKENYIARYTRFFPADCLKGLRIGIYEHSSSGRDVYPSIFEKLGATVISLGRTQAFVPIDTEAVSEEDKQKARDWRNQFNLNAIFSTDGDGDRPLLTDENGEWLRGDILCILTAIALGIKAVATPVSSNTLLNQCGKFDEVLYTKIGSPYVIDGLSTLISRHETVAGFEANGGFILGSAIRQGDNFIGPLPTRDSVLPALVVLAAYAKTGIKAALNLLPQRYTYSDRIQAFPSHESTRLISLGKDKPEELLIYLGLNVGLDKVDYTDGVRMTLTDSSILHLRASGNAPELRIYAEASEESSAKELVLSCKEKLKHLSLT